MENGCAVRKWDGGMVCCWESGICFVSSLFHLFQALATVDGIRDAITAPLYGQLFFGNLVYLVFCYSDGPPLHSDDGAAEHETKKTRVKVEKTVK